MAKFSPLEIKQAQNVFKPYKVGLSGPSGAGKTLAGLVLADMLAKIDNSGRKPILVIDTEGNSASLYVGRTVQFGDDQVKIADFDVASWTDDFNLERLSEAIRYYQTVYNTIIVDSASHFYLGRGGFLDTQRQEVARVKSDMYAWKEPQRQMDALLLALTEATCNIIFTMRSKVVYAEVVTSKGKTYEKKGTDPRFKGDIVYDFDLFFELGRDHSAQDIKDRRGPFDGKHVPLLTAAFFQQIIDTDLGIHQPPKAEAAKAAVGITVDAYKKGLADYAEALALAGQLDYPLAPTVLELCRSATTAAMERNGHKTFPEKDPQALAILLKVAKEEADIIVHHPSTSGEEPDEEPVDTLPEPEPPGED